MYTATFTFSTRQLDERFYRLDETIASDAASPTMKMRLYFVSLNSTTPARLTNPHASTYHAGA